MDCQLVKEQEEGHKIRQFFFGKKNQVYLRVGNALPGSPPFDGAEEGQPSVIRAPDGAGLGCV